MEGQARISADVLARYAADAACEVPGVLGLVEGRLHRHRGVRVLGGAGRPTLEVHLRLERGASIPAVGREVQRRVAEYLRRMADVEPEAVDVVVDDIGRA
ncbi:MAG: hypothetical protein C4306_01040 [Thermoleophilia bacterium]